MSSLQTATEPRSTEPASSAVEPEPLVIRMPLDVRSIALTVLAVLAVTVFLQWAEAMIM